MVKPTTRLGYMFGLRRDDVPSEPQGPSMFGRAQRPRMAGDVLPLNLLEPGEQPVPYATGSILRQGLRGDPSNLDLMTR
jgi:hypothetical protein